MYFFSKFDLVMKKAKTNNLFKQIFKHKGVYQQLHCLNFSISRSINISDTDCTVALKNI